MTYKEAKELYDTAKNDTALNALIEFFEYHNNNQNVLYYIADCYNELHRFSDGLKYVLPKIDGCTFSYDRYAIIIRKLFKGHLSNLMDKDSNRPLNKDEYLQEVNKVKELWLKFNDEKALAIYGFECRKIGCQKEFLNLIETIEDQNVLSDSYVKNAQLWNMYDLYIKKFSINLETTKEDIDEFLEKSKFIVNNCSQEETDKYYTNPYGLTIVKVVKILNQRAYCNYKDIIKWISLLDVDKLPYNDENQFVTSFGRECESASTREFYYYQITRAYEKNREYEKCIEICDKALSEDIKFHYKNRLWIKARKLYCECQIADDKIKAINNYKKIVDKNDFWFMKHKLASIYFNNNMMQEALRYNSLALDLRQEDKKLINVIYDLIYIFEAENDYEKSKICLTEYIKIRNNYGWDIPFDIEAKAKLYNINSGIKGKINLKLLKNICFCDKKNSVLAPKHIGTVKSFTSNGYSGFIETVDDGLIFFNKTEAKNVLLSIGDIVEFELGKNVKGRTAIKIQLKEKKNGKYFNK